jgi:hypothetical protein
MDHTSFAGRGSGRSGTARDNHEFTNRDIPRAVLPLPGFDASHARIFRNSPSSDTPGYASRHAAI